MYHGTITSCALPRPKWTFGAEKIDVVAGAGAKMYHSDFRLLGLPVFYFPFMTHSVENLGRQSGFLLPVLGQSNKKGFILGDSFYWAVNRSTDLTVGTEYFSARGWSQTGEFRTRPSESSALDLRYFGVLDRGDPSTGQNQSGEDVKLNGEWVHGGWRGVTSLNYLKLISFPACLGADLYPGHRLRGPLQRLPLQQCQWLLVRRAGRALPEFPEH